VPWAVRAVTVSDSDCVWTPPGLDASEAEGFLLPSAGIPDHAFEAIHRWITGAKYDHEFINWDFMIDFQAASRTNLGFTTQNILRVDAALNLLRRLTETQRTHLLDYMLSSLQPRPGVRPRMPERAEQLRGTLRAAGAGWTVGARGDRWGLVRVTPLGVAEAVEAVMSSADRATTLLRSAWAGGYGVDPSPGHAYFDAVRAVEVYSCPLISPKDSSATLGKDIHVLRSKPSAWEFALTGSAGAGGVERLISMMQFLWHSQTDRHGSADYEDVSQEEAQAAVLLASTLVGWLAAGALSRATPEGGESAG